MDRRRKAGSGAANASRKDRSTAGSAVEPPRVGLPGGLRWARPAVERVLGVAAAREALGDEVLGLRGRAFVDVVLQSLRIEPDMPVPVSGNTVPPSGPLVVVANHHFGAADALLALSLLLPARPDLKVVANRSLAPLSQLGGLVLPVPPASSPSRCVGGTRGILRHLKVETAFVGVRECVFVPFAMASAGTMTLVGFVIERLGPKRLLFVIQALLFIAVWQLQRITTPSAAIVYAVTLGSAAGVQSVTAGVTWAHYYGRWGLGRVQGAASMVMISAAALAPLPLAALHQWSGNYTLGLTVLLGIPIMCSVLAVFVPSWQEDGR
jgi:hypothetical protein